jgi:hypothetical protein
MKSWMQTEVEFLSLGDKRRNDRFRKIVEAAADHPTASVPQAQSQWYGTKATYQFWSSPKVDSMQLLQAIGRATAQRAMDHSTVLILHDTTNIGFSSSSAEELGYLDHGRGKGVLAHNTFVVSPQGVPLGLAGQHVWVRAFEQMGIKASRSTRPIEDKESYRWLEGIQRSEELMDGVDRRVHIADREADIYELFAVERQPGTDLLIRATHNRSLIDGGRLWDELAASLLGGKFTVELQKANDRPARQAEVEVRWQPVRLHPPAGKQQLGPVDLYAILVSEPCPPPGVAPLCWKLLTSLSVASFQQALQCVQWYSHRWLIERFHFVLKSGCGVEELQLRSLAGLQNALACYSLVAYRLMWLVYESRANPEGSCEQILHEQEWRALYSYHHKSFAQADYVPSLDQVIRWIAMLGGFLNRKGDGNPGIKNVWRGMRRLQDLTDMWVAFEQGTYQHSDSFG